MRQHLLRISIVLVCAMALTAAFQRTKSTSSMAGAAQHFLSGLSAEQKAKATFSFNDEERFNWHFVPRERKGLPLREMDGAQRALAHSLMSTGYSPKGFQKATMIFSLEDILRQQEKDTKNRRDPAGYFFTVFGAPSETGTWGWRVEGHHVALNVNIVNGKAVATSPSFFGANPAEIKDGPRRGLRVLAREEDLARDLVLSLDAKQKPLGVLDPNAPRDIVTMNKRKVDPLDPKGLAGSRLNKKQAELLMSVIEEYAGNMPEDLAEARMAPIRKAGLDKIYFAWLGSVDRGQGHYYRIQGPTFLIEYDNTQNNANHIHSVWRDFNGDFGTDLLAAHYPQYRHGVAAGR
jgi:hypothetical protein